MKKTVPGTDEYRKNEYSTNRLLSLFLLAFFLMGIVTEIGFAIGGYPNSLQINSLFFIPVNIIIFIAIAVAAYFRFSRPWIKNMLLTVMTLAVFASFCYYSLYAVYLVTLPAFIASRYFDRKITRTVSVASVILFTLSCVLNIELQKSSELFQHLHQNEAYELWESPLDVVMFLLVPCAALMVFVYLFAQNMTGNSGRLLSENVINTEKLSERDAEISMAADIQKSVLPAAGLSSRGFSVRARELPAKEVGGDFYDYFMLDDNRLCVIVADVSDKGLTAAMFMMSAKKALRCAVSVCRSLDEAISLANRMICTDNEYGMFLTLWMAIIDTRTGTGRYINAGHPFPLLSGPGDVSFVPGQGTFPLSRAGGLSLCPGPGDVSFVPGQGTVPLSRAGGLSLCPGGSSVSFVENDPDLFIGSFPDINPTPHFFRMFPGDKLLVYTDGLTDAVNSRGERFGTGRVLECMKDDTDAVAAALEFSSGAEQFDDITALVIECASLEENRRIEKTVPATVGGTAELSDFVMSEMVSSGFQDEIRRSAGVCIDEICNNISEYAYPDTCGEIGFTADIGANCIEMTFSDKGPAFDPLSFEAPARGDPLQIGGLGLTFVKQLSASASYRRDGDRNRLTLLLIN